MIYMQKIKLTLTLALALAALTVNAQKIKVKEGNLDALKGTTALNAKFEYDNLKVGGKTETEYIAEKKAAYNKKEAGRGDTWEKAWHSDKEGRYEQHFDDLFEKQSGIDLDKSSNAKYTLIFKTKFIEPGYNIYVSRKNAELDGEAWIVETANPSNVIAKLSVDNCPGRTFGGNDYDSGVRIEEAYEVAGKGLGKFLKKELN